MRIRKGVHEDQQGRPTTGNSDEPGTYFRFRQNVQDSCGLNLCLLDFVGCCDCTPSAGDPLSDVEMACMAELRAKCDRPRECIRWRSFKLRYEGEEMPLIRLKKLR
jgi:hypothetical protein